MVRIYTIAATGLVLLKEWHGMANYRFEEGLATLPNDSSTLTQQVYEALRDEIVAGKWEPGQRLVRRTLSKRLGVSPMPITEALFRLEAAGLIDNQPLLGARVKVLTLQDVHDDEVLREAIECQAARECSVNADDKDLAKLMQKAKPLDRMMSEGNPRSTLGMRTHLEFHLSIALFGCGARLAEELERIWSRRLMRINWIKATHYKRPQSDWHQQLCKAISSRDPDVAEAKAREHVCFGRENDKEALEYTMESGVNEEDQAGK